MENHHISNMVKNIVKNRENCLFFNQISNNY